MENAKLTEAVELLSDGGVLDKIKADKRAEREAERAILLVKLTDAEQATAEAGATAAARRAEVEQRISDLETQLAAARAEMGNIRVPDGYTVENLRGKLRRLSDPRIAEAINQALDLSDKARGAFKSGTVRRLTLKGYVSEEVSNALEVSDVLAAAKIARDELEALQVTSLPENLDAVIAQKLGPVRRAVRKLHGFS